MKKLGIGNDFISKNEQIGLTKLERQLESQAQCVIICVIMKVDVQVYQHELKDKAI